jgi:hypothetical protein
MPGSAALPSEIDNRLMLICYFDDPICRGKAVGASSPIAPTCGKTRGFLLARATRRFAEVGFAVFLI